MGAMWSYARRDGIKEQGGGGVGRRRQNGSREVSCIGGGVLYGGSVRFGEVSCRGEEMFYVGRCLAYGGIM